MVLKRVTVSLTALLFLFSLRPVAASTDETYIVTLKPGANLRMHTTGRREGFELKHTYGTVLNGYAAVLSPSALAALEASDDVQGIEKDRMLSISQKAKGALDFGHQTDASVARRFAKRGTGGAGVDIYVLDTGIRVAQPCFGGRAVWGKTFGGYPDADANGHGTAIAASALCATTGGTATSAIGIAVKVLSDSGSGTISDIISGVNWVVTQFKATGHPSIAVMAIGGAINTAIDNAVAAAVASGVHVVVTAGFSAMDVSTSSPARVATAVTVGSLPRSKSFPSNSNYGPGLDVWSFYPTTCPSDLPGCNTPTNSVAYVAGYLAVAISEYGNKPPAALTADLVNNAVPDVTGVPSGTTNRRAVAW